MRLLSWVFLHLGVFLVAAGVAYGLHSGDYDGLILLLITAGCALLVGAYMIKSLRDSSLVAAAYDETGAVPHGEPHVGPTIWPLVLSLSFVGLVLGALTSPWVLVAGGVVLVVSGTGWLLDVHRQWLHHYRPPADPDAAVARQER